MQPGKMKTTNEQEVSIRWTENDIPHIQANTYRALGYGYGYVHARDRLAELSAQAIALRGERSKYFGAEAFSTVGFLKTTNLNSDLMYRLRLQDSWVKQAWQALSQDAQHYITGYVDGLNAYRQQLNSEQIARIFNKEPIVDFSIDDVIRATMRFGIMKELIEIGPYLVSTSAYWQKNTQQHRSSSAHQKPVSIEGGFGSNAWAFGGDITQNQSGILLANPHSAWKRTPHQQRIYMHQYHLTLPGELDVAGSSFLGFPLPMTGYNANLSWTILDAAPVTAFVLQQMQVEADHETPYYQIDGQQKPLIFQDTEIDVLNADGQVETQTFTFAYSELGPLYSLPERPNKPKGWYAITNAGERNAQGIDQFLAVAKATSTRHFIKCIEEHRGILCQLLAADKFGDVAYTIAGNVLPISDAKIAECHKGDASVAFNVFDGASSKGSLRDTNGAPLKADKSFYPNIISRGIIHNTNNSYKFTEWGVEQPDFPAVFGQHKTEHKAGKHIAAGLRYDPRLTMSYKRMKELQLAGKVTADNALRVLFDNRNYAAETFLDTLLKLDSHQTPTLAKKAFDILRKWDRKNNSDSKGALLFNQFWNRMIEQNRLNVPSSGDPEPGTQLNISHEDSAVIINALEASVTHLQKLGFAPDAEWGTALKLKAGNQWLALHGGSYQEGILNGQMPEPLTQAGFANILFGTVYIQLTQWHDKRLLVQALLSHGQSENNINSQQLKQYAKKQLCTVPFHQDELQQAEITRSLTLRLKE